MEDDDKQIILIGDPVDANEVAASIPSQLIYKILPRPLVYDDYIDCINIFNKQAASDELKRSILIVDDDPNYMSLVREWLKDSYKVSTSCHQMAGQ